MTHEREQKSGVCIHGALRRQCETCDLAERLDAAEAKCKALEAEAWEKALEAGRKGAEWAFNRVNEAQARLGMQVWAAESCASAYAAYAADAADATATAYAAYAARKQSRKASADFLRKRMGNPFAGGQGEGEAVTPAPQDRSKPL